MGPKGRRQFGQDHFADYYTAILDAVEEHLRGRFTEHGVFVKDVYEDT